MKATLFDQRCRWEALTSGDRTGPGLSGSAPSVAAPLDKGVGSLQITDSEKQVAGSLSYTQTETGLQTTLVMSYVRSQPMKVADSKMMGSKTPNTATHVQDLGWPSQSDHYSKDETQKKD